MKIHIRFASDCNGSVLLVTMMTGLIVGTVLASYLALVRHQNATVARSQDWNAAMASAEAGVEEALAQLTSVPLTTNINRSANGWVLDAGAYRLPARPMLHGSYNVGFTDAAQPVIYATGTIIDTALNATLSRTIEVMTTNAPVFSVGMTAISNITMKGNNIMTDSYMSTDPKFSTNGLYIQSKARTNGDVASINGLVDVGNGDIRGDLLTGPTGSYSTLNNGSISGTYANDFNAEFEDAKAPQNLVSFLPPVASMQNQKVTNSANIVTYAYAFRSTPFSGITLTGINGSVYVGTNVQVTLYVSGDVSADNIYIAPGGKLTLYMAGSSFSVNSALINNGTPAQFSYLGLKSNTSIDFHGNAAFTGTIYALQAALTMGGGGSDAVDFCGACIVKSVSMNGHMNFHYDEALGAIGPTVYKAMSWREL